MGLDVNNIPFWALTYIYRLHFPLVPDFMIGNLTKSFVYNSKNVNCSHYHISVLLNFDILASDQLTI